MSGRPASARPPWLTVRTPSGGTAERVDETLGRLGLRTVCRDARCPNVGECWGGGTATVLVLGGVCTRGCAFCSVARGTPAQPDPSEPSRVAEAAASLRWRHVVVTSVTRDDLPDGGASHFAAVTRRLRALSPAPAVELLVPDFRGSGAALSLVVRERPDLLAHNVETVPRLYPLVRPGAEYERSIALFRTARQMDPQLPLKSGILLGFGETRAEVARVLSDLFDAGCRSVTLGQYLPPSRDHLPATRYLDPEEFEELGAEARRIGFPRVRSAPLVRSSYRAGEAARDARAGR